MWIFQLDFLLSEDDIFDSESSISKSLCNNSFADKISVPRSIFLFCSLYFNKIALQPQRLKSERVKEIRKIHKIFNKNFAKVLVFDDFFFRIKHYIPHRWLTIKTINKEKSEKNVLFLWTNQNRNVLMHTFTSPFCILANNSRTSVILDMWGRWDRAEFGIFPRKQMMHASVYTQRVENNHVIIFVIQFF